MIPIFYFINFCSSSMWLSSLYTHFLVAVSLFTLWLVQISGTHPVLWYKAGPSSNLPHALQYVKVSNLFVETHVTATWNGSQWTFHKVFAGTIVLLKIQYFLTVPKMWSPKTVLPWYIRIILSSGRMWGETFEVLPLVWQVCRVSAVEAVSISSEAPSWGGSQGTISSHIYTLNLPPWSDEKILDYFQLSHFSSGYLHHFGIKFSVLLFRAWKIN